MAQSQTSGYDVLVQLSEQELNDQLEANFAPIPFASAILPISGTLEFRHLELDVDPNFPAPPVNNGIQLIFDALVSGNTNTVTVQVSAVLGIEAAGTQRTLGFYTYDQSPIVPGNPNLMIPIVKVLSPPGFNFLAPIIRDTIKDKFYAFGAPINMPPSSDPLTPTDMHVKVIDDPNPSGIDCVTLMLNTEGTTGGNPAGVTTYLGQGQPNGAVVTLSNQLVVERLIRPRLQAAIPGSTFNPPCDLASPVPISIWTREKKTKRGRIIYSITITIYLQTMSVFVDGDHLRVVGTFGGSGNGWSIDASFSASLFIEVQDGVLQVVQRDLELNPNFNFAPWVWVVSALTGGALSVVITAAAQSAINAALDAVAAGIVDFASKLPPYITTLPTIPLGPSGGQLTITDVLLDDLTIRGPVTRVPAGPVSLALLGDLHVSHTDSTTTVNGVLFSGLAHAWPTGSHVMTTRRFAHRGLFRAVLSQAVFPATYSWSLAGVPISGTGSCVILVPDPTHLQLSPTSTQFGLAHSLQGITIHYQVSGSHCWIWTPAGTTLTALQLFVTLTDGAGHHWTASRALSCIGVSVTDFIAQPLTLAPPKIGQLQTDPSGGALDTFTSVDLMIQNRGPIVAAIDRREELSAAFKRGLTVKPVPKTSTTSNPTKKPPTGTRKNRRRS